MNTKINNKINNTKKTKKKNNNKVNNLAKFLYKTTLLKDTNKIINLIFSYFESNMNNNYLKLKNKTVFFGSDRLGKSGGQVGILNKSLILKYYKLDENIKYIVDTEKKCIRFYFPFNELIINSVFSNLNLFLTQEKYNIYLKKYKKYLIPIKDIGIYEDESFMISEKVGLKHKNYFYTNLEEILLQNYIPLILKNFNNQEILDAFQRFFVNVLDEYSDCIKFLNKEVGYINTDLKCKNVFIKKKQKSKDLLIKDFITNFIPLISDLDKATIKINDILIMPKPTKKIEKFLTKHKNTRLSKVFELRYNCFRNTKLCNRFQSYQYDLILLFYDIYILLYTKIYNQVNSDVTLEEFYKKFEILNRFVKKKMKLNNKEFKIFYERIDKSFFIKNIKNRKLTLQTNIILFNFCNYLKTYQ